MPDYTLCVSGTNVAAASKDVCLYGGIAPQLGLQNSRNFQKMESFHGNLRELME